MRHPLVFVLSALCLLLAHPARAQAISSAYTDLTNCPRDTTHDEDAEEHGSDAPTDCPGPGGEYRVHEYYSAYGIHRSIDLNAEPSSFSVRLLPTKDECPVSRYGNKVEWRLKGGKPFAVIQRVTCFEDTGSGPGKRLAEYLVVKGLKGFESLDGAVSAKQKNANEKARALADKAAQGR
ncbi:hypothetical protein [Pyxidicoccus trucidator]|uniref:hypothetical protein n=1 Tax=Pyxidicoccus trucidator TaxID=2709662 RepID=UPI0013DA46B4|nr:hypothetical protein [Pyxidicoccus trucidator]